MTYLEHYPDSLTLGNGLISRLSSVDNIPWSKIPDFDVESLERAYSMRSGFKKLTSVFSAIDSEQRSKVIASLYAQKWTRLWNNYILEYNPLEAYRVTESGKREINSTDNNVINYGRTTNNNASDTGTVNIQGNENGSGTDSLYGFNSANGVPSDSSSNSSENTSTETRNLTNNSNIVNSGKDERDVTGFEQEDYSYTKTGNIGYTSPPELLMQDMELWKTAFFDIVFSDIDFSITISVY